ncbi:hypothetical protein OROHE_018137 [Orobanche hederae]
MPSQEILKIRDGTPLEMPSQEILKIHDGTPLEAISRNSKIRDGAPLEAEEILTYIKKPSKWIGWHFYSKLDVPSNVVQEKRVAQILFFKIRPSQEILKIRDGISLEEEEILIYIKKLSKRIEILKIRDGTPLEAEEILIYIKSPLNGLMTSQEILRIRDEILKIRDGTPLEAEEILIYIKNSLNGSLWNFSSKLDVPSYVVQKKIVARILFFKIRLSQEILKIRDGTPLESEEILTYIKKPSKRAISRNSKIRDGAPLEAEEILTYIKKPSKRIGWHFYSKLDVPSNILQKKRVAWILFFKIRTSQEILRIRDGIPLEAEEILTYIKTPSKRIGLALF